MIGFRAAAGNAHPIRADIVMEPVSDPMPHSAFQETFEAFEVEDPARGHGRVFAGIAIAAVILGGTSFVGGIGSIWGTLIGGLIIAVLSNGLTLVGVDYASL